MTMHADTFRMSFMFFEQSLKETIHLSFSLLFRLLNNEGRCHDVNLYSLVLSGILHILAYKIKKVVSKCSGVSSSILANKLHHQAIFPVKHRLLYISFNTAFPVKCFSDKYLGKISIKRTRCTNLILKETILN